MRIMDQWVLVVVVNGRRTFRLYDEDVFVQPGQFFLLPPHIPHYGLMEDEHEAYFIHFLAEGREISAPGQIDAGRVSLPQYGRIPDDVDCLQMLDYIARHCMSPFANDRFLTSQVQALLYRFSLFHQRNNLWKQKNAGLADRILHYIQDNFSEPLHSSDYESAFDRTYRQLNSIFTGRYGITIKQMQIKIRMDHAKIMLASGYSISEVSRKCGFDDYLYFLKAFRKMTGMTPNEYRKNTFG